MVFLGWGLLLLQLVRGGGPWHALGMSLLLLVIPVAGLLMAVVRDLPFLDEDAQNKGLTGTALPMAFSIVLPGAMFVWGRTDQVVTGSWLDLAIGTFLTFLFFLPVASRNSELRSPWIPILLFLPCLLWGGITTRTLDSFRLDSPRVFSTLVETITAKQDSFLEKLAGTYELSLRPEYRHESLYRVEVSGLEHPPLPGTPVELQLTTGLLGMKHVLHVKIIDPTVKAP